ncbi:tetratricopeptide repeat protein [Actinoplanes sp. NPDC026619]|uniref:AfsR/SARP family transcriptional regulator n=1 Tax=Actinoplanes sp. NPDC026619 TaxID=3155798 RepID=UPI0033E64B6F
MELRLLGAVEFDIDGRSVTPRRPQERLVLAALGRDAGRLVSTETLIDRVWDTAPTNARRTLHVLIAYLRGLLRDAGEPIIETSSGGYLLRLPPDRVDAHRLRRLVDAAAAATGERRRDLLREALEQWRGEPLAGLRGAWADRTREALCQLRIDAVVAWSAAETQLGRPTAAIETLTELIGANPYVETLPAALMHALIAAGRSAEALEVFGRTRRRLADDLGIDPGAELQAVHHEALTGGPARADRAPVPAELPAPVPSFVGRQAELAELESLSAVSPVTVISGTAGVGKTALAMVWAHRVADRFGDGTLYVNLHGYDPAQPMSAATALEHLLASLEVPLADIPADPDARATRYRTTLAGRRALIVLDNAAGVEQIRPLLPGAGRCAVVVTSRDRLSGLVAVGGAGRVDLGVLPALDAIYLLRELIGQRVLDEPEAAQRLAAQCAHLPLALRIAAEHAAGRPGLSLRDLAEELDDEQSRLDVLSADPDAYAAVSAVFSWSLRHLPATAAATFTALGHHPGVDFTTPAVAALTGGTLDDARAALATLGKAHLVFPAGGGRFGLHDLLRAYAARLAAATGATAPAERICGHYVDMAARAADHFYPAEAHRRPAVPPGAAVIPLPDAAAAQAWLDAERQNLVAVARTGIGRYPVWLSTILYRYLDGRARDEAAAIHQHAFDAAEAAGDTTGQAHAALGLGATERRHGRYDVAADWFARASELFERAGNVGAQARALGNLAGAEEQWCRYADAAEHLHQAQQLYNRAGDRTGQALALCHQAVIEIRLGAYDDAGRHLRQSIGIARALGDRPAEATGLANLGDVHLRLGQLPEAERCHREALDMHVHDGDRVGEAWGLTALGTTLTTMGDPRAGADHHERALRLLREVGQLDGEAWAHNGLGEAAHAAGDHRAAIESHRAALDCATRTQARDQAARAHHGLGRAHGALGDATTTREHLGQAADIYRDLGAPELAEVEADLTAAAG